MGFTGTTAQYNTAKSAGLIKDGMKVNITDDYSTSLTALSVGYDNTKSGLSSTSTQGAIDEQNENLSNIRTYVGEDGKLHFTDASGADSVLPFSGKNAQCFNLSCTTMPYDKNFLSSDIVANKNGTLYWYIYGTCGYGGSYMGMLNPTINGTKVSTSGGVVNDKQGCFWIFGQSFNAGDKLNVYGNTRGYTSTISWNARFIIIYN